MFSVNVVNAIGCWMRVSSETLSYFVIKNKYKKFQYNVFLFLKYIYISSEMFLLAAYNIKLTTKLKNLLSIHT